MVKFEHYRRVNIVLVGVGGTGGHVVPHLARLIYSLKSKSEIYLTLVDGDEVEPKNLLRQHFIEKDLGKNKAQVMAERYSKAFGINIGYSDAFIKTPEDLKNVFRLGGYGKKILVMCGDNHTLRQVAHEWFINNQNHNDSYGYEEVIYIDSGNEQFDGQVIMGYKRYGSIITPPIGIVYPDILEPEVIKPVSCADEIEENPQNIMANVFASTVVMGLLNNILAIGECEVQQVTFNCTRGLMRPVYCDTN